MSSKQKFINRLTGEIVEVTFLHDLKGDPYLFFYSAKKYKAEGVGKEAFRNFYSEFSVYDN